LLRQQVTAVRDAAIESYSRKVRAALSLLFGPRGHAGNKRSANLTEDVQQTVISADSANLRLIVTTFWAEANELEEAREIIRGNVVAGNTHHFANAVGQFDFPAGCQARPAIGNEELQERRQGDYANDGCDYHRALATKCAVASRASSGTFVSV
jgi:hypothetical protein